MKLKCKASDHADTVYRGSGRLVGEAFKGRRAENVYRHMTREQLHDFAMRAYVAGWNACKGIAQAEIDWHEMNRSR